MYNSEIYIQYDYILFCFIFLVNALPPKTYNNNNDNSEGGRSIDYHNQFNQLFITRSHLLFRSNKWIRQILFAVIIATI